MAYLTTFESGKAVDFARERSDRARARLRARGEGVKLFCFFNVKIRDLVHTLYGILYA